MISDFEHASTWIDLAEAVSITVGLLWALSDMPTTRDGWRSLLHRPYVSGLNQPLSTPTYATEPDPTFDWCPVLGLDAETLAFNTLYADSGLGEIVGIVTRWRQAVSEIAQEVHVTEARVCEVLTDFVNLRSDQ